MKYILRIYQELKKYVSLFTPGNVAINVALQEQDISTAG
jgi:hypothetical protein